MIDWERLAEVREEVGEDDFDEIIELFLEEVEETLAQLHQTQNLTTTRALLHSLRGSALNMGFENFAQVCGRGEKPAEQQAAAVDTANIEEYYQTSKRQFLSELPTAFAE